MKERYVYILASKYNGTLYIGMTSDLVKRIWEHKNKFVSGFTAQYNVTYLVYYEIINDIQAHCCSRETIERVEKAMENRSDSKNEP